MKNVATRLTTLNHREESPNIMEHPSASNMNIEGVDDETKQNVDDRFIANHQYTSSFPPPPEGEEKVEIGQNPPSPPTSTEFIPPNGGLEAWLLVVALFLIFANTW